MWESLEKYNNIDAKLKRLVEDSDGIFTSFGYVEKWRQLPINDEREYYWAINKSRIYFFENYSTIDSVFEESIENGNYYSAEVREGPFNSEGLTAFVIDTNCDGNQFFGVYDDSKNIKLSDNMLELL